MRINFDRLSKLAGLPGSSQGRKSLNESYKAESAEVEESEVEEGAYHEGEEDLEEGFLFEEESEEVEEGDDEIVEVDEAMLVQELRRAKRIMQESKRRKRQALMNESKRRQRNRQRIEEAQLKRVIDQEVQNVMRELNLTGGWVYGDNKPKRSRNGYSHQGSFLGGPGFRK